MEDRHANNVYALNKDGAIVHVTEVESGRKGYYCMGCKKELQAVHSSDGSRIDFFRHDPKFIDSNNLCSYRDETFRHKLAKEILQRIKAIKVPALKKYPPPGQEGVPMLLSDSKIIEAKKVLLERQFFEGDDNQVYFGS